MDFDEDSDRYRELCLRHVESPTKKRTNYVESGPNFFGFGMDVGAGAIETKESHVQSRIRRKRQFQNALDNNDFEITINPDWIKKQAERTKAR